MFDLRIDGSNPSPETRKHATIHLVCLLCPLLDVISLQLTFKFEGSAFRAHTGGDRESPASPTRPSAWRVYSGLAKAGCVYVHATARELPLRFVLALHALIAQSD